MEKEFLRPSSLQLAEEMQYQEDSGSLLIGSFPGQ